MHTATLCPVPHQEETNLTAKDFQCGEFAVITGVMRGSDYLKEQLGKPVIFAPTIIMGQQLSIYLHKSGIYEYGSSYTFRRLRKGEQIIIEGQ